MSFLVSVVEDDDADLVDYGYSRDNKFDCKQVNLRLNITDEDGIPTAFFCFFVTF
jgi:transposase